MASTNQSPAYLRAHGKFLEAETNEERLEAIDDMIKECPKHKSSENMLANLKTRKKKILSLIDKQKKSGKSTYVGIKKQDHQIVLLGKTNSGKSSLLKLLTNANPKISEIRFTTTKPVIGMFDLETINMQLIENPAIDSEYNDKGLTNSADAIIMIINNLEQIKEINPLLEKATKKRIILYNYKENLNENQLRKLEARMKSKKYNFIIINLKNPKKEKINQLKNKLFQTFDKIRVYTKEPNQKQKSPKPIILKQNSNVKDAAEKILKGFSQKIKQTKIWGPSSKFSGQVVGLKHKLKDLDVVEFKTK